MLKMDSILIFSENPKALADFYTQVFGEKPGWEEGGYFGFKTGDVFLMIGPHDKVSGKNTQPERIMINFQVADVEKEFERIEKLGATVIARPYHPMEGHEMLLATFADPDGNYFQLGAEMK